MEVVAKDPIPANAFWSLIERSRPAEDNAPLFLELLALGVEGIPGFYARLAMVLLPLDTRAHAGLRRGEYFSPDDFLDRRLYVVSQGQQVYDDFVREPRRLPEAGCGSLEVAPVNALEELLQEEVWIYSPLSIESGRNPEGGW